MIFNLYDHIIDELPFRFVESKSFQAYTKNLEPIFNIHSCHTLVKDVLKIFGLEKDLLKNLVKGQRIYLATNIWKKV